ncbi:hypothetical protein TomTYG75_18190 [Sphingobium sp. TomTYG75]
MPGGPVSKNPEKGNYIAFAAAFDAALLAFEAALLAFEAAFSAAFMALSAAFEAFSAALAEALAALSSPFEQAARPSEAARTSERAIDLDMGKPLSEIKTSQTTLGEKFTPHCACGADS